MANIKVLDQSTINQIAAGEVIERPASVIKELLENAIDAKATAVTVETKDGGTTMIRVTDNGCGIHREEIPMAFLRHATSKIQTVEDLFTVSSLGFRGEALSSIAAVSQVELITKTDDSISGSRYQIEGGEEKGFEEVGAPEGTTFIARNIFYNTPARRKFLKTAMTEGAHVADLVEKIALSHPEVSIRLIQNNQNKLHTSGNHNLKDIIYAIFGREIAGNLLPVEIGEPPVSVTGYVGKPLIARGNRNFENYFINGRYIKSSLINKAIEDAYKPFMMQHKYPFTMLYFTIDPTFLDVNVHPAKMELRFRDGEMIYKMVYHIVSMALSHKELIPAVELKSTSDEKVLKPVIIQEHPEPFERRRMEKQTVSYDSVIRESKAEYEGKQSEAKQPEPKQPELKQPEPKQLESGQLDLFEEKLLTKPARSEHILLGQLFDTYWLVEFHDNLYIIDQHAAHEKVLYEKTMASLKSREYTSQILNPPIILTLNSSEILLLERYMDHFTSIGFEIEAFGGKEYAVRAVPANLFSIAKKDLLMDMIDHLSDNLEQGDSNLINEKIASMSCKAAVKGNHRMSALEADQLIDQLLKLENPYACPHGRPTIISMSKYELEKKFKRIV
ncbi:MAG: DNA mismatch repair endonuclease MutL [Clostridium sp.]